MDKERDQFRSTRFIVRDCLDHYGVKNNFNVKRVFKSDTYEVVARKIVIDGLIDRRAAILIFEDLRKQLDNLTTVSFTHQGGLCRY